MPCPTRQLEHAKTFGRDGIGEHGVYVDRESGEEMHVAGARSILAAAGLDESALQCPPDLPSGREAMLAHVRAGGGPLRICHNCSGKHAAMLATCVANGWDIASYREVDHPLQVAIRAGIEAACGADGGMPNCAARAR